MCYLRVGLLNAQGALENYAQKYPTFRESPEHKLMKVSQFAFFLYRSKFYTFFPPKSLTGFVDIYK